MAPYSKKKEILKIAVGSVKMYDASHMHGMDTLAVPEPYDKKHYPSVSLSLKEAPSLMGAKVGDICTLIMKMKVTSHNSNHTLKDSNDEYRLEIQNIGTTDEKKGSKSAY